MKWSQAVFLCWPLWAICYWCSPEKPIAALVLSVGCVAGAIFLMIFEKIVESEE